MRAYLLSTILLGLTLTPFCLGTKDTATALTVTASPEIQSTLGKSLTLRIRVSGVANPSLVVRPARTVDASLVVVEPGVFDLLVMRKDEADFLEEVQLAVLTETAGSRHVGGTRTECEATVAGRGPRFYLSIHRAASLSAYLEQRKD